jgi:hypothetical protein
MIALERNAQYRLFPLPPIYNFRRFTLTSLYNIKGVARPVLTRTPLFRQLAEATRAGTGAGAGTGTETGTGAGAGTGVGTGTGAETGAGAGTGAEAGGFLDPGYKALLQGQQGYLHAANHWAVETMEDIVREMHSRVRIVTIGRHRMGSCGLCTMYYVL